MRGGGEGGRIGGGGGSGGGGNNEQQLTAEHMASARWLAEAPVYLEVMLFERRDKEATELVLKARAHANKLGPFLEALRRPEAQGFGPVALQHLRRVSAQQKYKQ